ncbi:uncharacterized protein LOC116976347 isoform X1 [Amblyraja radiata]|uniref:uncharacterized protein LOC116976347 isoform X1 n=1 Tax=Amblyraja radiata TaxID=386614 RepID=UPI0014020F82|nr:uncharacterized protein LOC116976347 isoform X1 [Amblyraja radiata]
MIFACDCIGVTSAASPCKRGGLWSSVCPCAESRRHERPGDARPPGLPSAFTANIQHCSPQRGGEQGTREAEDLPEMNLFLRFQQTFCL